MNFKFPMLAKDHCGDRTCVRRDTLSDRDSFHLTLLFILRIAALVICMIEVGAALTALTYAQSPSSNAVAIAMQGVRIENAEKEIAALQSTEAQHDKDISKLYGFGAGISAALGALKIIEILVGRQVGKGGK